jgi:predicted small metal-binding protein
VFENYLFRQVSFDCDGVIRADAEAEALEMAAEHARTVHGLQEVTPAIAEKVRSVMREEPAGAQ